ncbi:MAG TPA: hypothetical protein VIT42_03575 [Microlunatus sp.]
MQTSPLIIVLLQIAAAVLFGLGIRAYGTRHCLASRSGLWIGPVLWALAGILAAPAAAAWLGRLSAIDAVFVIAVLVGFAITVTVAVRTQPSRFDPTPGDELS